MMLWLSVSASLPFNWSPGSLDLDSHLDQGWTTCFHLVNHQTLPCLQPTYNTISSSALQKREMLNFGIFHLYFWFIFWGWGANTPKNTLNIFHKYNFDFCIFGIITIVFLRILDKYGQGVDTYFSKILL